MLQKHAAIKIKVKIKPGAEKKRKKNGFSETPCAYRLSRRHPSRLVNRFIRIEIRILQRLNEKKENLATKFYPTNHIIISNSTTLTFFKTSLSLALKCVYALTHLHEENTIKLLRFSSFFFLSKHRQIIGIPLFKLTVCLLQLVKMAPTLSVLAFSPLLPPVAHDSLDQLYKIHTPSQCRPLQIM